jgi:hypothetical protein
MQAAIMQAGAEEIIPTAVHIAFIQGVAHGVALLGAGAAEGIVAPQVSATMVSSGLPRLE